MSQRGRAAGWLSILLLLVSCEAAPPETTEPGATETTVASRAAPFETLALPVGGGHPLAPLLGVRKGWKGGLDGMVERRLVRALVAFGMPLYFFDGPHPRGLTFEMLRAFERNLNESAGGGPLQVQVIIIPVPRDDLLPALLEGRGDIAAANLTITPKREALVDFSLPLYSGVREVVVTGPTAPPLAVIEDLSGVEVHVRRSSSYYESLEALNARLREAGRPEVRIVATDEHFRDEDLLQMVNAGLVPATVVDSHKAEFWAQIFDDVKLREDLTLRSGGEIAWAFRKGSPRLRAAVNRFLEKNRKGSLLGNLLLKRYLKNAQWVENALSGSELAKFNATVDLFRQYGRRYDFDWVLLAALGYQESRLDQSKRSAAGAIGVMQLLPRTAADPNVGIPDIENLENNIHAGTRYLRFLTNRYFEAEPIEPLDKLLFSLASYNAGPARVRQLRLHADALGLDPDVWFDNVEIVAAREIGRETVQYVRNIVKYYVAYRQVMAQRNARQKAVREGL